MSAEVVLITGAGSPTGRDIAVKLSASYALILSGRDESLLLKTRSACAESDKHDMLVLDLAKPDALKENVQAWLTERSKHVHHFVHMAGVFKVGALRSLSCEQAQEMFRVNFFAAAEMVKVLSAKKTNSDYLRSVILVSTVSSGWGVRGFQYYGASRAAVDAFVRGMALELAPRIRINSLRLGALENERGAPDLLSAAAATHPLGLGSGEDVASVIEFLISDGARWITGQNLTVDGGWSCGK